MNDYDTALWAYHRQTVDDVLVISVPSGAVVLTGHHELPPAVYFPDNTIALRRSDRTEFIVKARMWHRLVTT